MSVYIPEVHLQTDVRRVINYWISGMVRSKIMDPLNDSPDKHGLDLGTWLVRSPAEQRWHGMWGDVKTGVGPSEITTQLFRCLAGAMPRYMDTVAVLQPTDHPDIHHTTFVHTVIATGPPRPPLPGIEMGLFPLDNLPLHNMPPAERDLIPEILQTAVQDGMHRPSVFIGSGRVDNDHSR